jgi:hypothetical protein
LIENFFLRDLRVAAVNPGVFHAPPVAFALAISSALYL